MNTLPQKPLLSDEAIQSLADGDLTFAERAKLLQAIDAEAPERWRDVALALLGTRMIAEALRESAALEGVRPEEKSGLGRWLYPIAAAAAAVVALSQVPLTGKSGNPPPLASRTQPGSNNDERSLVVGTAQLEDLDNSRFRLPILMPASRDSDDPAAALLAATSSVRRIEKVFADRGIPVDTETSYVKAGLESGGSLIFPVSRISAPSLNSSTSDAEN